MLLTGRDTIRDVIAFPKAASGADPLTGAPTPITAEQRREAGIDAKPESAGLACLGSQIVSGCGTEHRRWRAGEQPVRRG